MRKMEQSAEQQKASTRLESSLETVNLIEFQAIKQVKTGTVDTRTTMGVNNTPSPEGRRRSRLDLPKVGPSGSELFVRDGEVPGTGTTTERRKLQGQEQQQRRSYQLRCLLH